MRTRTLVAAWNEFFFAPQSPVPIALFRILYGVLVISDLVLLKPDWLNWYGAHGWISVPTVHKMEPGVRLNLFDLLPETDVAANALFWFFLACAVLLTTGLFTRFSSICVFVCLTSIHQRNLYIFHSGDGFMRMSGFFLMFAPAGAALSIDRFIRVRRGKEGPEVQPKPPWAQRMIQLQTSLFYFFAFWWKSTGVAWVSGTALYYVFHLDEFRRFPLPAWALSPFFVKLGSWSTLAVEFSLGVLLWVKELRYPILFIGIMFHLALEYTLNVPLFQWMLISTYVLFVDPRDLRRAGTWIQNYLARERAPRV